jgi:tetratricopeptide (TPR) repeat protein
VGLRSSRLDSNLAEIFHRRAEELLTQGDAQRHRPGGNTLVELLAQIHQHLGYQAATANRLDEAQSHWQTAVALDSTSFRLTYNLALAYERSGSYLSARQPGAIRLKIGIFSSENCIHSSFPFKISYRQIAEDYCVRSQYKEGLKRRERPLHCVLHCTNR